MSVQLLLKTLGELPEASAADLRARLGISGATLSRLVAAAGDSVSRWGRARRTRYLRTRRLESLGTRLPVWTVDPKGSVEALGELVLVDRGRTLLDPKRGVQTLFAGLPPELADMCPQGYLGRGFARRHPDLSLPLRLVDWTDDHRLLALARRGEDCAGAWIVGEESLNRWLAQPLASVSRTHYVKLSRAKEEDAVQSSAAGEQPKFTAFSSEWKRHLIVKFSPDRSTPGANRWRDLLLAEHLALEVLREGKWAVAETKWLDVGARRYLEVERFDRVGRRGRRGLLSLSAVDNEYLGLGHGWVEAAKRLRAQGRLSPDDAQRIVFLDTFGTLIGNGDRHFGNLSFFTEPNGLRLAPVYDMLPMVFAPEGDELPSREFRPSPPTASSYPVWPEAARWAQEFWARVASHRSVSASFRTLAKSCQAAVAKAREPAP